MSIHNLVKFEGKIIISNEVVENYANSVIAEAVEKALNDDIYNRIIPTIRNRVYSIYRGVMNEKFLNNTDFLKRVEKVCADACDGFLEEEVKEKYNPIFYLKIDTLLGKLSARTTNALKNDETFCLGDLVSKTDRELLKIPNFGKVGLNELKTKLAKFDLHLGMSAEEIKAYTPPETLKEKV